MNDTIKILARIKIYSGIRMRQTPFLSKYRPLFDFDEKVTKLSGSIDLFDRLQFEPGSSGNVHITFIKGIINDNYFRKGNKFKISEDGQYILGEGEVIEVM